MPFSEKYTEEHHAKLLLKMLESKDPCSSWSCPCAQDGGFCNDLIIYPCMEFIGLPITRGLTCPCAALGKETAIKLTWLALEAKGYLD